jgi:plasmid replication initiation protein
MALNFQMDTTPTRAELVVKSNALINAMFDMGLQEMRFLAFAASQLPRNLVPVKGKPVDLEIDVSALAAAFELDPKSAYRETKALADRLMKKIIEFETDGRQIGVGLLSKREYHIGEGKLWLRFDEDLVPHLLGLKENFTKYRIKDVYQFKSANTWRVYELLKQYKEVGKREFEIDELKLKLGLSKAYNRIDHFKSRIINPAIEEINNVSDILVAMDQAKRGRCVTKLIFHILPNEHTMTHQEKIKNKVEQAFPPHPPQNPDFARRLREEFKVSTKQADQLARLWEGRENQAAKFLARIKRDYEAGMVKSLGGLTFKILKNEGQKTFLPGV